MSITLFELVAKLALDTSGFTNDVNKAHSAGESLSGQLTSMTASAVAMGNAMWDMADRASRALWNFAGDLVQTAADVQAEQAQFASVFGESAETANGFFDWMSDANNIYVSRLRKEGASMFAQFKSGGAESTEALGMMGRAMQLAADAAAFYDVSLEDASYRLRSFLRGNVEAGESIGLFTSSVARDSKAAELYGAAWADLNEVQREMALLSIAEDAYANANATGQAAREAENYSNILGNLNARWREVKATLGAPILSAITPAIEELGDFLENNPELVAKFAEGIGMVAESLSNMFISAVEYIGEHSDEIVRFLDGLSGALGFVMTLLSTPADTDKYKPKWSPTVNEEAQKFLDAHPSDTDKYKPKWSPTVDEETQKFLDSLFQSGDAGETKYRLDLSAGGDKSTDDASESLLTAVNDMRTTMENLPGMITAALTGVSIGIDGGPLLGWLSSSLARNARQSKNTSTASA